MIDLKPKSKTLRLGWLIVCLRGLKPRFRPEKLDLRPERLDLRPERLDFRPEKLDLRPERPDLKPKRPDKGGTNKQTNQWTN